MAHSAIGSDLRNLMGVAIKLRQLADNTPPNSDRKLSLQAATALEERAKWMAASIPPDAHDQDTNPDPHHPVDIIV
jgi:hypothetical protein